MKYKFNTYEILYAIMLVTNTAVVRFFRNKLLYICTIGIPRDNEVRKENHQ